MLNRLVSHWVYGGFLAGVLLLLITPLLVHGWSPALLATFLCLPVYMVHQYEEHDADRFRLFFNATIGKGRDVLSPVDVFVANVPGVWGVCAVSFWLAATRDIGFGLIALYLVAVNALVHVIHALIFRRYNPGLATGILFFGPLAVVGISAVQRAGAGTPGMHALGMICAVAIHAAILIRVKIRARAVSG